MKPDEIKSAADSILQILVFVENNSFAKFVTVAVLGIVFYSLIKPLIDTIIKSISDRKWQKLHESTIAVVTRNTTFLELIYRKFE